MGLRRLKGNPLDDSLGQTGSRHLDVRTAAQDLDDKIDHIAGVDQSLLHFLLLQLPGKQRCILSLCQLILEIHMMTYDRHNSHRLRSSVYHRKHIDTERVLKLGLLI